MGSPAAAQSESRVGTWDDDEIDSALHHLGKVDAALDEKVAAYGGGEKQMLVGKRRSGQRTKRKHGHATKFTGAVVGDDGIVQADSKVSLIFKYCWAGSNRAPLRLDLCVPVRSWHVVCVAQEWRWARADRPRRQPSSSS